MAVPGSIDDQFLREDYKLSTFLNLETVTRATSWATSISCTVRVDFNTEPAARDFFDRGAEIRIALSHPVGSAQDNDWNNLLANVVGEIRFGKTATTNTGTDNISAQAIGYSDLTAGPDIIFNGLNIGGGSYTANDVVVTATRVGFAGLDNANGSAIDFIITLSDDHTNAFFDTVASGTEAAFHVYKVTDPFSQPTPTFTVNVGF